MFTKLNISGVTITNTAYGTTTTLKIDNINIENEVKSEEVSSLLNTAKEFITTAKKNDNTRPVATKKNEIKINAFNQQFLITVFTFKMASALRKEGQKYAIIKDIRTNEFFTLSKDGLSRHNNNPYFYDLYEKKIENGDCIQQRKFYSDYIPTYEEL